MTTSSSSCSWRMLGVAAAASMSTAVVVSAYWYGRQEERIRQQRRHGKSLDDYSDDDEDQSKEKERKRDDGEQENAILQDEEDEHRQSWYIRKRRVQGRLSFHESDDPHLMDDDDDSISSFADETEESFSVGGPHNNRTNNWNHFEGFEERRRKHGDSSKNNGVSSPKRRAWAARIGSFSRAASFGSSSDGNAEDEDQLETNLEGEDLKHDCDDDDALSEESSVASSEPTKTRGGPLFPRGALPTIFSERNLAMSHKRGNSGTTKTGATTTAPPSSGGENRQQSRAAPVTPVAPQQQQELLLHRSKSLDDDRQLFPHGTAPPRTHRRTLSQPEKDNVNSIDASSPLIVSSSSIQEHSLLHHNNVRHQNRAARAHYNARIMPDTVFLVRHGQSRGNDDENLYASTPDNAMPLTALGWAQARHAGQQLKRQLEEEEARCSATMASNNNKHKSINRHNIHFIVSPYVRTVETFHGMVSAWCDPSGYDHIVDREERLRAWYAQLRALGLSWHEDPRIREQDFGNYQEPDKIQQAKHDRHHFGAFYYRFQHGESASDVYDRVSTFLDSLWRSFDTKNSRNYVLVTHGIAIRVILTRYFRYSIDQFHLLANPRNCEIVVLGHDGAGRLELAGRYDLVLEEDDKGENDTRVVGYKFHKRLRVLPPKAVRKVKIRMCFDEN